MVRDEDGNEVGKLTIDDRPDPVRFKDFVIDLLNHAGFSIKKTGPAYYFRMCKGSFNYFVDIKYYRSQSFSKAQFLNAAYRMMEPSHKPEDKFVIIIPSSCIDPQPELRVNDKTIYLWTIENLLFFANTYDLKSRLAQFVDVSLEQIIPKQPEFISINNGQFPKVTLFR